MTKIILFTLTLIICCFLFVPAQAQTVGGINCTCYLEGYAAGATRSQPGMLPPPNRCRVQGKTQFPGESTWSYSKGFADGINVEGPLHAGTRSKNAKWARDRANEASRNRRLICP